ncbi:hypothetical protein BGZ83_000434 [Gryganskiella cystojenkinii]|nr:hypothetical protein BGZ83_000434 [Gryganskiella cystojenkinii]
MVALPLSSPTLVSSTLSSASPLYPTYGNTHSRASSCASSARNISPGPSAPSSPSSSSSSSPRFRSMDPASNRHNGSSLHSPSSSVFPLSKSHPFSKLHKNSSSSSSSSSSAAQDHPYHMSKQQHNSSATSLDQALNSNRSSTMSKIQVSADLVLNDYDGYHRHHTQHQRIPESSSSSSSFEEPSLKHHSRIDIANLLNRASSVEAAPHATEDASGSNHLRAITEESDDLENNTRHSSASSSVSLVPGHSSSRDYRQDEGHLRSFVPSVDQRYPYSNDSSNGVTAPFSATSSSVPTSAPMYSISTAASSQAPRLASSGSLQRSASVNMDRNNNHAAHDYVSYEEDRQQRTDRSKSDYALHQRNYGPFMASSSPPLSSAVLPKGAVPTNGGVGERGSSITGAHLYYEPKQQPSYPPSQSSYPSSTSPTIPLAPQPHSGHPSGTTRPVSNNINNHNVINKNNSSSLGQHHSQFHAVSSSSSSSSARPLSDYAQLKQAEKDKSDQLRRPSHGPIVPILPPPAAMLSGATVTGEPKPPRIYGRDSTADDIWPPIPRKTRIVPVDAPNETRLYPYSSTAMLPPPPPPFSSNSSVSSYSISSSSPSYPSSYSAPPKQIPLPPSQPPQPRRIYGIDAADIPTPRMGPPPAPYGSNQYPQKPLQQDDQGHGYQRQYNGSGASTSSHGSHGYGYTASSSSVSGHHHSATESDRARYDYDQQQQRGGWNASQNHGPNTSAPMMSSSSSFAHPRPYSRPHSPSTDHLQPPSWYQNYAHSVPPKPQARPYGHQQDSHYYGARPSGHQQHANREGWSSRSSYQGGSLDPLIEDQRYDGSDEYHHRSSSSSKRTSQKSNENLHSIHPFDTEKLTTATKSSKSKSKKIKRIKNVGQDEDMIVMDDEFYAVKAKRKRANASQLSVLNAAFERSYFPSTEERLRLSKQCRMCPRTVQIWFQNKRQSVKARTEAMEAGGTGADFEDDDGDLIDGGEDDGDEPVSSDGQKRSIDDQGQRKSRQGSGSGSTGERARKQEPVLMQPSEAVMSALHIQLDGRSVDYFSRKRRATIAKMEQSGQKQQKQQQQQSQPQPQEQVQQHS